MKKLTVFISILILALSISFFVLPKNEFSVNENRYLSSFPVFSFETLFSGEYISDLEAYINDHFPFRDYFVNISSFTKKVIKQTEINDVYLGSDEYLFEKYENPENTDKLIKTLNDFYSDNSDINFNLMLVPSSGYVNSDLLPNYVDYDNQEEAFNYIYDNILFNYIDLRNPLIEENNIKEVYFKSDHHYNIYGAYVSYVEFCIENNIEFIDLETINLSNSFYGTLYSKVGLYNYSPDKFDSYITDTVISVDYNGYISDTIYESEFLTQKDKYSYYFGGNHPLITINTMINTDEEILIIKDSFANSLIPFLTNHYSKIHVIDPRFYNLNISDYIIENNISNILILYGMNNIDSDTGIYKIK